MPTTTLAGLDHKYIEVADRIEKLIEMSVMKTSMPVASPDHRCGWISSLVERL